MSAEFTDHEARVRAVDPTRSVILQAPAGSGKTTVLIERLLVLLAQAQTPEEILAITFTRKAAAEMALRVAQVLKRKTDAPGDERAQHLQRLAMAVRVRSQARGWRLEENPERLRIQTLDALNRALALQMPLAARGSGSLNVLAQPETAYRIAARRALLDAQSDTLRRPDVQLLFERMENDFSRCEALIAAMLAKRTHWLPYLVGDAAAQLARRVRESLEVVVQGRLARARQLLAAALLEEGLSIGAAAARHLEAYQAAPGLWCELSAPPARGTGLSPSLRQWQALAALALTLKGEWRRRLTVLEGFPPEDEPLKRRGTEWLAELSAQRGVLELLDELRELPDPQLSADETQVLGVLARLLELAVAELEVVFNELGRVDYPAIAAAARAALGSVDDPTDLALRLDTRIRHILVDEFQDTSLEQTRLLTLLTAGWEPGDGRTLFLVGDPMQSIYGFREAEVGMFLGARAAGIGSVALEALTLRRNFRSAQQVVQWNNTVFAACFPEVDDPRTSAVAYSHSVAARPADASGAVHLHRVLPGDFAGEAQAIVRVVTQLRAAQPAANIAILLSARAHAAPIVAALTAAQIPVAGVDLVSLHQLSIVRDLTALTQALDHLADRTAWLAILRAPWCGLTLKEISQIAGVDRRATVWERLCDPKVQDSLAPAARQRVRRLQQALAIAFDEALHSYANGREALARRAESAWLRLGGPAACAQASDLVHARAFFAALEKWTREPDWTCAQELPQRLKRLFAEHQAQNGPCVEIMTIHHAKGLEFDHVILPALGRQRRGNERPLLQWLDLPRDGGGTDLLMVAVPPAAAAGATALGRYVTRLQDQRERNEATRLLYVAATRARLQLHLFGQLEAATEEKPNPAPRAGTLLQRLWPAICDLFPQQAVASDTALPQSAPALPGAHTLERLSADWYLPQLPGGPQPLALPIASYEAAPGQSAAGLVEQAVCEVLRSLARRRWLPERDGTALADLLAARLQRLDCPAQLMAEHLAQGLELLQACFDDARLQWIFRCLGAADARAEVPLALTGMFAGRLTSIRADLSFVDPSGTRWLIDIAPRPPPPAREQAFALRLAQQVRLALELDQTPARAAVYLPADQLWLEGAGQ
jgi:ATP-dependent helicase/nuclease subunit A